MLPTLANGKNMPVSLIDIAAGVPAFVRVRRKISGGYGATPRLPATVEDTYHALRILSALEQKSPPGFRQDRELVNYLSRMGETEGMDARTTFHFLAACVMAGVPVDVGKAALFIARRLDKTSELAERYYCGRISREVQGLANTPANAQFVRRDKRFAWRDVSQLWMNIYLMSGTGGGQGPKSRSEIISWLQACQNYDGGFGFLPGTTSFIENTYTCLRSLALLDSAPRDLNGCRSYIVSCETGSGGFARANRATAFLFSTWHGIAALLFLNILEKNGS
jgi:hypothetical protein